MNAIRFSYKYNKKNKLNKSGQALIQLVAYLPRAKSKTKHKYISTNIYLKPDQWDPEKILIINHPLEARLNFRLSDMKASYEKKVIDLLNRYGECTLDDLERDRESGYLSFFEFFQSEIKLATRTKAKGTIKTYKTTFIKLQEFRPKLFFGDIDYRLIQSFDAYLHGTKLRQTVKAKYHKIFRFIINQAIKKDLFNANRNPYNNFKIKSGTTKPRVYLSIEEVAKIEKLKFEPEEMYLEVERDAFLFSCYTALRNETNSKITLNMFDIVDGKYNLKTKSKKTGKYINIPLAKLFPNQSGMSKPEKIISKYESIHKDLFGNRYFNKPLFGNLVNQTTNKRLKIIAQRANINKNLTTHVGRHTFATFMADKIPLHYLQAMLQHSSIRTTMAYTHLNEKMVSDGLDKVKWD